MNNRVTEDVQEGDGALPSKRKKTGANDSSLMAAAEMVNTDHTRAKAETVSTVKKRRMMYSKKALMPEEIFNELPYQKTLEALENEADDWEENLRALLCNYVCVIANKTY